MSLYLEFVQEIFKNVLLRIGAEELETLLAENNGHEAEARKPRVDELLSK